jgi:Spy/CpxP family protein refolding chaperone
LWVFAAGASAQAVRAKASVTPTFKPAAAATTAAPGQTTPGTPQLATLNQLTVADLVAGFQQFLGQLGQTPTTGSQAGLTPEQQQQVQGLQGQLDSEEITEDAFATQVHGILGDAASTQTFGVLGGSQFQQQATGTSDPLNLTAAQQQQAQDIATRLHDDIAQLRQEAHDQILSVLTADQQAKLNGSSSGQPGQPAQPSSAKTRVQGMGVRSQGTSAEVQGGGTTAGVQKAQSGVGVQGGGSGTVWQNPLDSLQLTDAQKAQIDLIRADLRVAVQARHQQACDEFFALLTPDQQALLYEMEQASGQAASPAPAAPLGE